MSMINSANLTNTIDTKWNNGSVHCACGWHKDLGDGFNQYVIDHCPSCTPELATRIQNVVTTGRPGNYTIKYGNFVYFMIKDCIHVQYSSQVTRTEHKSRIPE
jgi:hypothetical protein